MGIYQATCFFEQLGHGWSETYYRDGGSVTDLAALADFDRENLWKKRALMCGKNTTVFAQRASFSDVQGDSVLNYIPLNVTPELTSEDPNTALLLSCGITANTKRKNVFLRGIPDNTVVSGGIIERGEPVFVAALGPFLQALVVNQYGWMGTDVKVDVPVTNYAPDISNRIVFTLAAPGIPAPAVGNKVRVRGKNLGVGGKSALNKSMVVVRDAALSVKTNTPQAAFPFPGPGGFLTTRSYVLRVIANCRLQKVVERKAGKPSYISAGRSQVRPKG